MKKAGYVSKVGCIQIGYEEDYITDVCFAEPEKGEKSPLSDQAFKEIEEYFRGQRKIFTVPYKIQGSDFEKRVLGEMEKIPYGQTISYGELARKAGTPGAARAAGSVCRKNRLLFLVPCHRVVRADGSAGNYAGGTVLKERLLRMERGIKS